METLLEKREFKKGETIVEEGMESYNVYVIMSGEANMIKSYFGKEVSVRTLKKGDVFGALALIAKSPRAATVVARIDLTNDSISSSLFFKQGPSLIEQIVI